jgi:hypothetical protein
MANSTRRRRRQRRREALVYQHLEHVSRDLLERHPDVVRAFIGRNAGIYALERTGCTTSDWRLLCGADLGPMEGIVTGATGIVFRSISRSEMNILGRSRR